MQIRSFATLVIACGLLFAADGHAQTPSGRAPAGAAPSAPASPPAQADGPVRFELRPTGISRAVFTSDAPLETIDGVSTKVSGDVTVDLRSPANTFSGRVQIETASLRTGNDTRDEHLRSANWLDAQRYPNITFELVRTTLRQRLTPNRPVRAQVTGRLTIHGVSKEMTVPVTARFIPLGAEHQSMGEIGINADMLRVQSQFKIKLSDFGVSILPILQLKVSDEITVRIDITAFRSGQTTTTASATPARPTGAQTASAQPAGRAGNHAGQGAPGGPRGQGGQGGQAGQGSQGSQGGSARRGGGSGTASSSAQ